MVGAMVLQLTKGVPADILEKEGLGAYYSDHDHAIYPVSASGVPFTAAYIQSKGDPIADLHEDLAATIVMLGSDLIKAMSDMA